MTKVGKALAAHRRVMRDTPQQRQWRERHAVACQRAADETIAKFGSLNADNVREAILWQEQRIKELMK